MNDALIYVFNAVAILHGVVHVDTKNCVALYPLGLVNLLLCNEFTAKYLNLQASHPVISMLRTIKVFLFFLVT